MADLFDRLDKYMKYKGLNDNQLTVLAQLSVGSLGKQRKGSRGLSVESIAKILSACPDLNSDWLLIEKGEMLKKTGMELGNDMSVRLVLKRDEQLIRENERLLIKVDELEKKLGVNNSPPQRKDIQSADR